jgi:hypothetical protein
METTIEKNWHVDTGESVFETDAETLKQWIWEGAVLPHHRVSRGGLRWLEAGKVPLFAEHFATAQEMKELLGSDLPPAKTPMPPVRPPMPQMDDRFALPSEKIAAEPTPFGIKLMAGSAVALVLALIGGYVWAYHISSPRDFATMKNDPKIVALQTKYDKDKVVIEEFRDAKPAYQPPPIASIPSGPRLGPGKTGKLAGQDKLMQMAASQFEKYDYTPPPIPDLSAMMPKHDYDGELKNLSAQFETDKNKAVADIRNADSKSRFPLAAVVLFFGLGGLNLVRLKFSSRK